MSQRSPPHATSANLTRHPAAALAKTLSRWTGEAQCDAADPDCVDGVGLAALETSKKTLTDLGFGGDGGGGGGRFLLLITEWLSEPAQISLVGRELCFRHANGVTPVFSPVGVPEGTRRQVPDFKPKRPGGGHNGERPGGWAPPAEDMKALENSNRLDVALYEWARGVVREQLAREFPHLPLTRGPMCEAPPCGPTNPPGSVPI